MDYLRALIGLAVIVALAWLLSGNRKAVDWRLVLVGITIQLVFGLIIGKVEFAQQAFVFLSEKFVTFLSFAAKGAEFLYGDLSKNSIGNVEVKHNLGFSVCLSGATNGYLLFSSYCRSILPRSTPKNCLRVCLVDGAHYAPIRCRKFIGCSQYFYGPNRSTTSG
jgi:hypothetical protein